MSSFERMEVVAHHERSSNGNREDNEDITSPADHSTDRQAGGATGADLEPSLTFYIRHNIISFLVTSTKATMRAHLQTLVVSDIIEGKKHLL